MTSFVFDDLLASWEKDFEEDFRRFATVRPMARSVYDTNHFGTHPIYARGHVPPTAPKPSDNASTGAEREVLKVLNVDLKIQENAKAHHTERYELTQLKNKARLVVRRGQPFDIALTFDREFDKTKDDIRLVFDFGKNPREAAGTRIVLHLSDKDEPKKWGAKIEEQSGGKFTIRVFTPPNSPVAKWKFSLDAIIKTDKTENVFRHTHDQPIYILFNPWCPNDEVFFEDAELRKEYVLNDTGRVYTGNKDNIHSMPWNYGQFEDFVLEVSMSLLDISGLSSSLRGNPIHVVRKISALVNSNDNDGGILVGNWSGNYAGGTSPSEWNGSIAILEEFFRTHRPVKYGQCWVFAAVTTTVCRSLGISCRCVTNFQSGHDTDGSLTIDEYRGNSRNDSDSIWNFHVWNEVWMQRPDLPAGLGGWQATDATPQETSEGIYCTGPVSVEAIKQGLVSLPYDGPFVFAEVNADKVIHFKDHNGKMKQIVQPGCVGFNISTKDPRNNQRLDITDQYKYPEGSEEERIIMHKAASCCSRELDIYKPKAEDVEFKMAQKDEVMVGEEFQVTLSIRNKSTETRTVHSTLSAVMVRYNGRPIADIGTKHQTVTVKENSETVIRMKISARDYLDKVTDMCHVRISVMSYVEETHQVHCDSDDFGLSKPPINIKVPSEMHVGTEYEIELSISNPLPYALTNCQFTLEAAGMQRPVKLTIADIPVKGIGKCRTKVTPSRVGVREIIVGFSSKELSGAKEVATVKIL